MARTISDAHILDAALQVITERGYNGATTRQIAAEAGINEVTLFRRFGNKSNLLRAVVEQEADGFMAAGIEYTGDVTDDLLRIVNFYSSLVDSRAQVIAMLLNEIPRHPELLEIMQTPMGIIGQILVLIERYQQEGVLVEEPVHQAFMALVGPLFLDGLLETVDPSLSTRSMKPGALVERYLNGRSNG